MKWSNAGAKHASSKAASGKARGVEDRVVAGGPAAGDSEVAREAGEEEC